MLSTLQVKIKEIFGVGPCSHTSPPTMRCKLERTGEVQRICEETIKKARKEKGGKLTVKKTGTVIDDNGHRVEAFAFEIGRFEVGQALYTGLMVDLLSEDVHLLLVRSDVTQDWHKLFPDIGTAQDWKVLRKCMDRFSPKESSHRCVINLQEAQRIAAETAAKKYLEQSGAFQQRDLEIFQDMGNAKLQMFDLCTTINQARNFPVNLFPHMIYVLVTRDADDLEEVQRVFKALDFSVSTQAPGLYVPSILVRGKKDLEVWRKSAGFTYITYDKAQNVDCLFADVSQTMALNDAQFHDRFPLLPVVVGSNIWSSRSCTEIDVRRLRFSDEELLVGRKYIASLLKHQTLLMAEFEKSWQQRITAPEAAITSYVQLWFQAFHFAVGTTLFPSSNALLDYLELTRIVDASRLRLRDDRESRYEKAIAKLKAATKETAWLYSTKPQTKAEALELLAEKYDAFLHQKDGRPTLAFTEMSLIRCARLEQCEINDFISKLKQNQLLTSKTHPVSFANREQHRFICIHAESLTLTEVVDKEGTV